MLWSNVQAASTCEMNAPHNLQMTAGQHFGTGRVAYSQDSVKTEQRLKAAAQRLVRRAVYSVLGQLPKVHTWGTEQHRH